MNSMYSNSTHDYKAPKILKKKNIGVQFIESKKKLPILAIERQ